MMTHPFYSNLNLGFSCVWGGGGKGETQSILVFYFRFYGGCLSIFAPKELNQSLSVFIYQAHRGFTAYWLTPGAHHFLNELRYPFTFLHNKRSNGRE